MLSCCLSDSFILFSFLYLLRTNHVAIFFSGHIDRRTTTTTTITRVFSTSLCIVWPIMRLAPHKIPATKSFFMPCAMTTAVISIAYALCWPIRKYSTILLSTCRAVRSNLDNSNLFLIPRKPLYAS